MAGSDPLEAGMSYVEKLDYREQAHRFAMTEAELKETEATKRARLQLRKARQETYQILGAGFFILIFMIAVIAWIYFSTAGNPHRAKASDGEQRREAACYANGGGWVPKDMFQRSSHGLCVFPGKKAQ